MTDSLGWALLHFVWQGTVLAAAFYIVTSFTRRPQVRYAAGAATLFCMAATPVVTFFLLAARHQGAMPPSKMQVALTALGAVASANAGSTILAAKQALLDLDWTSYFVFAWLAGVTLFALRALGGYLVLRQLVRDCCEPLAEEITEQFKMVQKRLKLDRPVRYMRSKMVETPAVVGWFRPALLIPLAALAGLSQEQLEAVAAHELAHIRRWDGLVNLFQMAVESLLFYHPAVWWVSRNVRNEREHCCDDVAVEICGDAYQYAGALALMESWRGTSAFALAATGGILKQRVARILGRETLSRSGPQSGMAAMAMICLAALLLGTASLRSAFAAQEPPLPPEAANPVIAQEPPAPPKPPSIAEGTIQTVPAPPMTRTVRAPRAKNGLRAPTPALAPHPPAAPEESSDASETAESKNLYSQEMKDAGLSNLDVDTLIGLKLQGVTPAYVKAMRAAGFTGPTQELIAMKAEGVSPEYVKRVRAAGWGEVSFGEMLAMKAQRVDPMEAERLKDSLGVSSLSLGEIMAFKALGVTPEYIRSLKAAGIKDLSDGQVLAAKAQGINPEFVQKARAHGFTNLTMNQLIRLKIADVF